MRCFSYEIILLICLQLQGADEKTATTMFTIVCAFELMHNSIGCNSMVCPFVCWDVVGDMISILDCIQIQFPH